MFFRKIRVLCLALVAALCLPMIPASAAPSVNALSYIVIDAESGQVLIEKNSTTQYDPASITKVMTLGLACEKAQGNWDVPLTISYDDIASIANTGSSHIALQDGEVITLEDALYAVMMASANDAANALAEYIGGDIAGGVAAMNAQLAELGLQDTHFDNPHGLNSTTHKVTAADMAEILRWAMQQPGFMQLFTNNEMYIMPPTNLQEKERYFSLSDSVRIGSSKYYVPEVVGSKTGYTDTSRYTYVALGESDGRSFICVTLHSQEKPDRYADAKALFDYAFAHFSKVEIAPTAEQFPVAVYGGGAQLGNATATASGASLYLYDGLGAEAVQTSFFMDEQYIIGSPYQAYATYTLPETANQKGHVVNVPMSVSGVDAAIQANVGISLPATLLLAPAAHRGWLGIVLLVVVLLLLGVGVVRYRRKKRRKSRYQRVHRYHR